jgi:anti-anti-sigma regulatory factor
VDEEWTMAGRPSDLRISTTGVADACVLSIGGVLDDKTYVPLRDAIVKTALDEPRALIVDVTGLTVRNDPA